jgi:hypothetical protein
MVCKRITTSINEDKFNKFIEKGGGVAEVLSAAVDSYLDGHDIYYLSSIDKLHASLANAVAARELVEERLEVYKGRLEYLNNNINKLKKDLEDAEQHATESVNSMRTTQLLREINQAIVYNDYVIPDIEMVVKKQLKEMIKLHPEFTLENQINVMKKYST